MNVDLLDWLISKSCSLIWRSIMDPRVFKADASGYHLHGFDSRPIRARFHFEECIATSVEDLYRPLRYKEVFQLRPVEPGCDARFFNAKKAPIQSDRSRLRFDEVEGRQLAKKARQSMSRHSAQSGNHAGPKFPSRKANPQILTDNGFELVPCKDGLDSPYHLVHHLGKFSSFYQSFPFNFFDRI